jgi:hypothetical protein
MYARVTDVQVSPDRVDEGISAYERDVLKVARDANGYRESILLVDRSRGRAIGMTFWETEDDRNKADAALSEVRANTLRALGVDPAGVPDPDLYEVAVHDTK